jgi:hypothetical protein
MKTIPGGCYRQPDGTFVNAAGETLPPAKVREFFELNGKMPPEEFAEKPKAQPKPVAKKATAKKASAKKTSKKTND